MQFLKIYRKYILHLLIITFPLFNGENYPLQKKKYTEAIYNFCLKQQFLSNLTLNFQDK